MHNCDWLFTECIWPTVSAYTASTYLGPQEVASTYVMVSQLLTQNVEPHFAVVTVTTAAVLIMILHHVPWQAVYMTRTDLTRVLHHRPGHIGAGDSSISCNPACALGILPSRA